MKNTRQALATLLLALLAAIFVVGCSDGSEDVDVDIEQGAVDTGVSDTDNSSSGSYNSDSTYYGTYTYTASVNGTTISTMSFTFTSTSWTYSANGASTRYSSWEYSNGHIYCYIDGTTSYYDLTVISSSKLSFAGVTFTKQ